MRTKTRLKTRRRRAGIADVAGVAGVAAAVAVGTAVAAGIVRPGPMASPESSYQTKSNWMISSMLWSVFLLRRQSLIV